MYSDSYDPAEAVITTTYVVWKKSPIIHAKRDDEEGWQFLSAEMADMAEAMLVRLDEIIEIDPSIKDILEMDFNHHAIRKDKNSEWIIIANN